MGSVVPFGQLILYVSKGDGGGPRHPKHPKVPFCLIPVTKTDTAPTPQTPQTPQKTPNTPRSQRHPKAKRTQQRDKVDVVKKYFEGGCQRLFLKQFLIYRAFLSSSGRYGAKRVGAGEGFPAPRAQRCGVGEREPPWRAEAHRGLHAAPPADLCGGQGRRDPLLRSTQWGAV